MKTTSLTLLAALLAMPACAPEPGAPTARELPGPATPTAGIDRGTPSDENVDDGWGGLAAFAPPSQDALYGPDTDGDGIPDPLDQCPGFDDALDGDGDGIPDACDLCDDTVDLDGDGSTCDDCDDLDPTVHPDAPEACDGLDQDCDGVADNDVGDNYDLLDAGGFNVFVFGDLVSGVDITGRAAAANAVLLSGFAVAQADPGGVALVAGNDLDLSDGTVYGDAWHGGSASVSNVNFVGGALLEGAPVDFGAAEARLLAVSAGLGALPANCATVIQPWGAIELFAFEASQNVCAVDAADLASAPAVTLDAPAGSTVVINVVGADVELGAVGLNVVGTDRTRVLWNAPEAATVSLSSLGFQGSLLAPQAAVQFDNGSFDGQLIAASLAGSGEPHHAPFDGDLFFGCGPIDPPDEICDGLDNDGDGLVDEGFDLDGDGFTSCGGDCDDDDDGIGPGADEACDGVDTDCDGDLDNDTCTEPPACGDGVVDPPVLPACPDPNTYTQVQTPQELLDWIADPTTSLDLRGDLDMGGVDVTIVTGCHVFTRDHGSLVGVVNLDITAQSIDIRSPLEASGDVTFHAVDFVIGHLCYMLQGGVQAVTVEAWEVDLRGDQDITSLCVEADTIGTSSRSQNQLNGGPVTLVAREMDLHADFEGVSDFTALASEWLMLRSNGQIELSGDMTLEGGVEADVRSNIDLGGAFELTAGAAFSRSSSTITGGTSTAWLVDGLLDFHGDIAEGGDVVLQAGDLLLRSSASVEAGTDVLVDVAGLFDGRGKIRSNADVALVAGTYDLTSTHDFRFNATCSLSGAADPSSKPVNGCSLVP